MPHFCFINDPQQQVPVGYIERVCVYSPWVKNVQTQDGRTLNPVEMAWAALQDMAAKNGWLFMQGVNYNPLMTNKVTDQGNKFQVYCIQFAQPSVERAPVNAPYGVPHANGRYLTMPPIASKERMVPQGLYEQIDNSALPANSGDGLMNEMDGEGGTYTDFSPITGVETMRHDLIEPSVPVAQRGQ